MANLNKVMLIGNVTREPALTYTPSQTAVIDFGLATNRQWTSKDGEKKEEAMFVDCRGFSGTAETINKYVHKGDAFMVEGRLSYETWTAQDGSKKSRHRVIVESFQFLNPSGKQEPQTQQQAPQQSEPESDCPI